MKPSKRQEWYRHIYLQSDHWADLRAAKLAENPFCERCEGAGPYDVHHKRYKNLYSCTLQDLQTLCRKCHDAEHKKENAPLSKPVKIEKWADERERLWKAARIPVIREKAMTRTNYGQIRLRLRTFQERLNKTENPHRRAQILGQMRALHNLLSRAK